MTKYRFLPHAAISVVPLNDDYHYDLRDEDYQNDDQKRFLNSADEKSYLKNISPAPSLPPNPYTLPNPFKLPPHDDDLPYPFTKHSQMPRSSRRRQRINVPPFVDELPAGPFIDLDRSGNVTALVGRLATLNCRVNQIGNRTVSVSALVKLIVVQHRSHTVI